MEGIIELKSNYSVKKSIERATQLLKEKGYHIFGHIDHQENAEKNGKELRPTQLVIFGNPKVGTALMVDQQSIAIDLPSKILAWEDENGQVWMAHNDMKWLAKRHQLSNASAASLEELQRVIQEVCKKSAE